MVLWHLANPEMQRQARIQLIYGMDDACMVRCTVWMEEVPLVQVDRLALAFQYLRGNPSKIQKNKTKTKQRCVSLQQELVFAKITEDFLDECVAGSCQKGGGLRRGLLNFMGGGTED